MEEIKIKVANPAAFEKTIQELGVAFLQQDSEGGYVQKNGCYTLRIMQNADFIKFAIKNQGYGEIVK